MCIYICMVLKYNKFVTTDKYKSKEISSDYLFTLSRFRESAEMPRSLTHMRTHTFVHQNWWCGGNGAESWLGHQRYAWERREKERDNQTPSLSHIYVYINIRTHIHRHTLVHQDGRHGGHGAESQMGHQRCAREIDTHRMRKSDAFSFTHTHTGTHTQAYKHIHTHAHTLVHQDGRCGGHGAESQVGHQRYAWERHTRRMRKTVSFFLSHTHEHTYTHIYTHTHTLVHQDGWCAGHGAKSKVGHQRYAWETFWLHWCHSSGVCTWEA